SATRSRGSRLEANSSSCSGVVSTRPAERTSPPSAIATSQKSRCTSNPIALPALLTSSSPLDVELAEKQRANDNDRYVLTAHPGKSQGRPPNLPGLEAHRPKRPAQPRSPGKPLSRPAHPNTVR